MKRIAVLILVTGLLLTACSQQATPTASDAEMATKIAQILTNMPSATGQGPKVTTATVGLPTVAVTMTKALASATQVATLAASVTAPAVSATPVVSATVTPTKLAASPTGRAASATPSGPTPTGVAGDPRTTLGKPTWTDAMNAGDNWPTGADPSGFTEIGFQNGFMELSALKPIDGWRLTFDKLTNAYIEMTVNSGSCLSQDRYGLIARVPSLTDANRGYLFGFTCDGKFSIRKWDGASNSMTNFIVWKTNAAINAGTNKVNRMGVMMNGNKLSIYANGVLLGDVLDNTWLEGNFGIFAGAHESTNVMFKVDELNYWKLP